MYGDGGDHSEVGRDQDDVAKTVNVPWRGGVALFGCLGDLVSPPVGASAVEVPMMTTMMYYIGGGGLLTFVGWTQIAKSDGGRGGMMRGGGEKAR